MKRDNFRGLADFEGGAIPLFNLKSALDLDGDYEPDESLVAVLIVKGDYFGILLDKVIKVTSIDSNYFEEFKSHVHGASKKVLWEGSEIILIDGNKLFVDVG